MSRLGVRSMSGLFTHTCAYWATAPGCHAAGAWHGMCLHVHRCLCDPWEAWPTRAVSGLPPASPPQTTSNYFPGTVSLDDPADSSAGTACGGPSDVPGSGPSSPGSLPPGLARTAPPPKSQSRAGK